MSAPIAPPAPTTASEPFGLIDERRAIMETLTAIRRAGADILITYYARDAARLVR